MSERMKKLNNAGVNTEKYFTVKLEKGLPAGSTVSLVIGENGTPVVVGAEANSDAKCRSSYALGYKSVSTVDPIMEDIIKDGYVKNTKLHRRFVMAQMFRALNYKSYDGKREGFNEYLKTKDYAYSFRMMLEEVRVLSKLETRDGDTFLERSSFFTRKVISETIQDYLKKLKKHVEKLPEKKCKGVPYKKVQGVNIFVDDLNKKLYAPIKSAAYRIECARTYADVYYTLRQFVKGMVNLSYTTAKSSAWIDAYKGAGAYYTLKNLFMYHGCFAEANGERLYDYKAVRFLDAKREEYRGEGWRLFALMKKVIADNQFDFKERMLEIQKNA